MNFNKRILIKLSGFFICSLIVLLWKSSSFVDIIINIDEIEWIYNINKCILNPIPFVGFDAHTTGPLSIYLLLPLKLFQKNIGLVDLRIYNCFVFIIPTMLLIFINFKNKYSIISILLFTSLLLIYNKDFYAYNSEYPIILFISFFVYFINRKEFTKIHIVILVMIIIALPLIKFQAILYSILFTLLLFWKLSFTHKKQIKFLLFLFLLSFVLLFLVIRIFIGFDIFYYSYIIRNFQYAASFSSNSWKIVIIDNIYNHIVIFLPFYIIILTTSIVVAINYGKRFLSYVKDYDPKSLFSPALYTGLFLISFLSILIPKNNFIHYYVLMFPAIVYLFVYLLMKVKLNTITILTLILIINVNYFQSIFESSYKIIVKGHPKSRIFYEQYKISKDLENAIDKLFSLNKITHSLVVLGWFNALPIYYKYKNQYKFPYRSGHTEFLIRSSHLSNQKFFHFEMRNLFLDIYKKNCTILDVENVIIKIKSPEFHQFISENFILIKQTEPYTLLIPKKLN